MVHWPVRPSQVGMGCPPTVETWYSAAPDLGSLASVQSSAPVDHANPHSISGGSLESTNLDASCSPWPVAAPTGARILGPTFPAKTTLFPFPKMATSSIVHGEFLSSTGGPRRYVPTRRRLNLGTAEQTWSVSQVFRTCLSRSLMRDFRTKSPMSNTRAWIWLNLGVLSSVAHEYTTCPSASSTTGRMPGGGGGRAWFRGWTSIGTYL